MPLWQVPLIPHGMRSSTSSTTTAAFRQPSCLPHSAGGWSQHSESETGDEHTDVPNLQNYPRLSTAWTTSDFHNGDVDELFFARMVGAVPDSDSAAQETWLRRRVFELRQELRDLEMTVRNSDTTESTGAIVAAATATAQWAVAVSPSIEGPTDLPFHVADVLDFTSLGSNGARLTLESTLNKTFVRYGVTHTPSAPSSWPVDRKKPPRPVERHRYSVRHTLAERSPDRSWPHERVPSVAVVHLTQRILGR